jgi:hypothetical protein
MDALAAALAANGFRPLPSRLAAELARGGTCALSITAAEDARLVAVALGAPETLALDLLVDGGSGGRRLASDVSPGRRGAVSFAARRGESYTITALATAGDGTAIVAVFGTPLSAPPPPLAALFDADPAPRLAWTDVVAAMGAEGWAPAGEPIRFEVAEAARRAFPFELTAGRCYTFAALGSAGVDAIALRVLDGSELASADFAERYHAWARLCAEADLRALAAVDVAAGTGSVRLGLFEAAREAVAAQVGPPIRPAPGTRTLATALRSAGGYVERRGYGPATALPAVRLDAPGARAPIALPPDARGCYALVAVAEDADADVDLQVVLSRRGAPGEKIEITDPSAGPDSRIAVCHGDDVTASAIAVSVRGFGRVGVALHPLPEIELATGGTEPPLAVREAAARLVRVGLRPAGTGASMHAEAGRCYGAIAFAPGGRISRLAVRARGNEELATEWSGDSEGPEITWCAAGDGDYDLAATATGEGADAPTVLLFGTAK